MRIKYKSKMRQKQRERIRALKAATAVPKPKTTSADRMRKLRARRKALLLDDELICTGVDTSNVEPVIKVERADDEASPDVDLPSFEVNVEMEHENEIKEEIITDENIDQCQICLSVDRKMSPLDDYEGLYKKLLFDIYPHQDEDFQFSDVLVCWECHAALRSVARFQRKIRTGHEMLLTEQDTVSLSTLTTVVFSDSSPHTIYLTEVESQTDNLNLAHNTDDNQEDNELHSVNKEKPKNTLKGKIKTVKRKPKYKVIERVETFKRFDIDLSLLKEVLDERRKDASYKRCRYKCPTCVLRFDDKYELDDHNQECHNQEIGSHVCDICQSRFRDMAQLVNHNQDHSRGFFCRLCSYRCSHEKDSVFHAKTHRRANECLECGHLFEYLRQFNDHYKRYHEKFTCERCGSSFKKKSTLIKHVRETNFCRIMFTHP